MNNVLVTGGEGLIGSAVCKLFLEKGWYVISLDNNMRGKIFGSESSTVQNVNDNDYFSDENIKLISGDIRNDVLVNDLIKEADAVVHCAAQPSHPRSLEIPMEDFDINARGTLTLLEAIRKNNLKIPFVLLSSNKVYGDLPNTHKYKVVGKRYVNVEYESYDESLSIDQSGHTPFGVSKTAADLYTQEYAKNFGLKTCIFRGGCLTGKNSKAVSLHGFLPYIINCALSGKKYTIYGGGYRVRDQLHSSDVAMAAYQFINEPKSEENGKFGKVYNMGGGRQNSVSIFETIDAIEKKTGKKLDWSNGPERESDHMWWISNTSKFSKDYPNWSVSKDLDFIFNEIIQYYINKNNLEIDLLNNNYFRETRNG